MSRSASATTRGTRRDLPHAEIGVQDDAIHAIVAAPQQTWQRVLSRSVIQARYSYPAARQTAPQGPTFFAARSAKKRRYLDLQKRSNGEVGLGFLRRPGVVVVILATTSCFRFRPPDSGSSNAAWRRSAASPCAWAWSVHLALRYSLPARLRFKAAMRSMTGEGAPTARGLMGSPLIFASISSRKASW